MDVSAKAQDAAALFHILDEQAALFQEWLALEGDKKEALFARDHKALEASVTKQSDILRALDGLEGRRRHAAARLVPGPEEPTLSAVADALPQPLRDECLRRGERLAELTSAVQQANELGLALLQQAAAYNQALLHVLVGDEAAAGIYDPSGMRPGATGQGRPAQAYRIDRQA